MTYRKTDEELAGDHRYDAHRCGRRDDQSSWFRKPGDEAEFRAWQDAQPKTDEWRDNGTEHPGSLGAGHRACSYCGSMNPEDLIDALANGIAELQGTDKGYKAYVEFTDGRQIGKHHKFYFQHFSLEQWDRFRKVVK